MNQEERQKFNEILNSIPLDILKEKQEEEFRKETEDFLLLKNAIEVGTCSYCGQSLTHFSERKACFHWLLGKAKGFKKKHFPLLYRTVSYHQLEAYLRWVANTENPIKNINDLSIEKGEGKIIETTIRYKNLEWSFSCSHNDRVGHQDTHEGNMPHYHFQMKIDGLVIINYGGFHIPFDDYDEFCFAVEDGAFDRLKKGHIHSAGMQSIYEMYPNKKILDELRHTDDYENAQFETSTLIQAKKGSFISGDDIVAMLEKRDRTGIPIAKQAQNLKNVSVQTIISRGMGVPDIAKRTPCKKR